jgi:hypothetical protein
MYDDGQGDGNQDELGYTYARSVNGTSSNASPISGTQDTAEVNGTPIFVYGFGQSAGNLNNYAPPGSTGSTGVVQGIFGAGLLLADGTYSSTLAFGSNNFIANVFADDVDGSTE